MRHRTNRYRSASAVLVLALGFSTALHAQSNPEPDIPQGSVSAAEHAKAAKVAYDVQDWAAAAREYAAAYKAEQKSEYLWGLAQAQRLGGDFAGAMKTYKAFKRAGVTANQGTAAEMMVLKCDAEIAKAEAKQARAATRQRESEAASAAAPAAAPEAPVQVIPETEAANDSGPSIAWLVVGTVATAGLGAATIWSGIDTQDKATVYEAAPTEGGYNEGEDLELRTNLLLGATALAAATTVLIAVFTDWSPDQEADVERSAFHLTPAVSEEGGVLLLGGCF